MKRLFWLAAFGLHAFTTSLNAQQAYDPMKMMPPSPTAASLGIYGDYNIGHYTGKPNISVPLYKIATNNHSLPVYLQYDASGVRVAQQASWVGLGWSLVAGGVITRMIRGLDDFDNSGFNSIGALPPIDAENQPHYQEMYNGRLDGEPDIFSYNFGDYAGKFTFGKSADGSPVYMDNKNNLQVEYDGNAQWVVTDGHGYKYHFGTKEYVQQEYVYSGTAELPDNAPLVHYTQQMKPPVISSWYLDLIESPTGEKIEFHYLVKSSSVSQVQKTEKRHDMLRLEGDCSTSSQFPGFQHNFTSSRQVIQDVYLDEIIFRNGSIKFITTDRNDIEYVGTAKPQKLDEIIIMNSNGRLRKIKLNYGYFADGVNGRLKLTSVQEFGTTDVESIPPYEFYYDGNNLPNPYSKSVDHWGFYNQRPNGTLLPMKFIPQFMRHLDGAVRDADTDLTSVQKGVLNSIRFPTGGRTDFQYALNEYGNLKEDDRFQVGLTSAEVRTSPENQWGLSVDTMVLTSTATIKLTYNYIKVVPDAPGRDNIEFNYVFIEQNNTNVIAYSNWDCPLDPDPTCGNTQAVEYVTLPAGVYILRIWYLEGHITECVAQWYGLREITEGKKTGGGLRIKSITNYDSDGKKASKRSYSYEYNGVTTGRLITPVVYDYTIDLQDQPNAPCPPWTAKYLTRMSSSVLGSGLFSGSTIIGYDLVTETVEENGALGRTEYTFRNYEDNLPVRPFTPQYSSPYNGRLQQVMQFDGANHPVKKTEYDYEIKESSNLKAARLYGETLGELQTGFQIFFYYEYSHWKVMKQQKVTDYSDGQEMMVRDNFFYENPAHRELTDQVTTLPSGKKLITKIKYPADYTTEPGNTSFIALMKEKNLIAEKIEQLHMVKEYGPRQLVGGVVTEYSLRHGTFLKPSVQYSLALTAPFSDSDTIGSQLSGNTFQLHNAFKPEMYYDDYDAKGNPLTFHQADNVQNLMIWDYASALPVAKVTNATQADVAYTSFESDGKGNWEFQGTGTSDVNVRSHTGEKHYTLAGGTITKPNLTAGRLYVLSYWSRNGAYAISGASENTVEEGETVNGWKNFRHKIKPSAATLSLTGTGVIDELKIYPDDAQMTTYIHTPLVGVRAEVSENDVATYYEYDLLGRLKLALDNKGNILRRWDYHYQQR